MWWWDCWSNQKTILNTSTSLTPRLWRAIYIGQRPVQEHVISPPCLAPAYVTHLQPPWDNPDHLQWRLLLLILVLSSTKFQLYRAQWKLTSSHHPSGTVTPSPECHNEVQAICREDAQSHQIFRADLFELKEVHTQFKELMNVQALNTAKSHDSPPVWPDFLPPYRPFWPFQELVGHISCWWSVTSASTLAGAMKTELRSGMETLNPNKPGSYIPTSCMKKIEALSESPFTSILSSSILLSKFI